MKIEARLDGHIQNLTELKPLISENSVDNRGKFQDIFMSTIDSNSQPSPNNDVVNSEQTKIDGIPSWVDMDYGYDPEKPRKPNVRELTEALSGTTIENLHKNSVDDYNKFTKLAGELLYNTASSALIDERDWLSIMGSNDILGAAREETGNMLNPSVQINSEFDHTGTLVKQRAVLEDKTGNTLRYLDEMTEDVSYILQNYGLKRGAIAKEVIEKINPSLINEIVLNELVAFNEIDETHLWEKSINTALGAIEDSYHREIQLEEYEKL